MITKGNTIKIIGIVLLIMISLIVLKYATYFVSTENRLCKGNFTATVKRVIDGDTIEMQECKEHIRFSLVNTPEYYQPGYKEAKDFIANLCKVGSQATIIQDQLQPYDKYGRIVAVVYCQDKNLNAELVYNHLGSILSKYCPTSEFAKEKWAANDCA